MNKTKKIIIIVNSHLFVQQHLRGILSQKKFNTKIYIASNKNSNYFKKIKGINYINLLITRRPSFLDFISFISFFIIRLKVRPDITLSFTPKAGLINSLTTLLPGKTIHYFTGQRWVTFKGMKKTFYKLIDQFIIFCCTKTYSDSNSQSEFIAKSLSTKRPSVIHFGSISGVNLKLFNPSKKINIRIGKKEKIKFKVFKDFIIKGKDIKDKSIFGFVGRVHEDKGIFMLLRAFEKHLKNFPDDKLIIIGPIETPLENLKILYKYPKSILHIGFTQFIYLYYPFFSCLVLPSFREGFGSVIIEAAACKKATISSNIPGPTDFIKNMQNGYFIKKNSLYELEKALKFFSKNKNKAIKMGNNAYKLIIENFSEDEVTKKFLKEFGIY